MTTAFYCVADERYFLGAVGLVNSLRLVGHPEPILMLDCGLNPTQRELLGGEVERIEAPAGVPPWLRKTIAPLSRPAGAMVLIDTDMIVTRPLTEVIDRAADGRVVAFADRQDRHFDDWGELLGLGPVERGPYVSSGFVALAGESGRRVLELLDDRQRRVDFDRTFWRRNDRSYRFRYADQDVLNAILAAHRTSLPLDALPERLAATPPFRGLKIADAATLRCAYRDGTEPYLLHQYVRKPWLEPTFDAPYSRLLRRLLTGDDVAIRVPPEALPVWLRADEPARAERARINARDFLRWHLGDRLPEPIAVRLEDRRHRREGRE